MEEPRAGAWVAEASRVEVASAELAAVSVEVAEEVAAMAGVAASAAKDVPEEMAARVERCCTRPAR